jgi:transposase InsO family protein
MRQHRQVGVHARHRRRTARSDGPVIAADLVRRNFDPSGPNQLWAADVTQFHTGEGWLYLAAVLDLWSRRVIGWAIGSAVNADLVGDALVMAFQRRRPDRRVVHHSARDAAYTSVAFSTRLAELELDQSFSAVGSCYDNAAVESFFATLKRTRLDPPPPDMAGQNDAAQRAVRLHRSVLQHPAHSTAPRPSKPHRLREPRRRVTSPCAPSRGKTTAQYVRRSSVLH